MIAKDLCDLGLSYDLFTRTTTGNHEQVVQELFKQCLANGYIYKGTQKVAISPSTGRTLPDRYIEGTCRSAVPTAPAATSATPAATNSTRTSFSTPFPKSTAKLRVLRKPNTSSSTCRRSPKPISHG